jgi:hypothetical protein
VTAPRTLVGPSWTASAWFRLSGLKLTTWLLMSSDCQTTRVCVREGEQSPPGLMGGVWNVCVGG